jgi:hypothetical protein
VHSPSGGQASTRATGVASPTQAAVPHTAAGGNGQRRNMSWSEVKPAGLLQ